MKMTHRGQDMIDLAKETFDKFEDQFEFFKQQMMKCINKNIHYGEKVKDICFGSDFAHFNKSFDM